MIGKAGENELGDAVAALVSVWKKFALDLSGLIARRPPFICGPPADSVDPEFELAAAAVVVAKLVVGVVVADCEGVAGSSDVETCWPAPIVLDSNWFEAGPEAATTAAKPSLAA